MLLGCISSKNDDTIEHENNDITSVGEDQKWAEYLYNVDIETENYRPQTAHMFNQLSLGFNTREYITFYGPAREYYILNNDKYSNVVIFEWTELVTTGQEVRYEFHRYPKTYIIVIFDGGIDIDGWDRQFSTTRRGPLTIIAQDNKVILEYENDLTDLKDGEVIMGRALILSGGAPLNREILYNSPENEIEHIYLTLFVEYMLRIINLEHWMSIIRYNETTYNMEVNPLVTLLISCLKKYELSITRNLLFARHNYAFRTEFWQDFINTYYPKSYTVKEGQIWIPDRYKTEDWVNFMDSYYHENYVGLYTESEVIGQFNWFERSLLEIIVEYENN
jgi:hypothetical protein